MSGKQIIRSYSLELLKQARDQDGVKIITGIHRCGKSTLLLQFRDWLFTQGVTPEKIVEINLKNPDYMDLLDSQKLDEDILKQISPDQKSYVLIDEIQNATNKKNTKSLESLIRILDENPLVDLYLAGMNGSPLSKEFRSEFEGRLIEIPVLPLSLQEISTLMEEPVSKLWPRYFAEGGLPALWKTAEKADRLDLLEGLYSTILVHDIVQKEKITNLRLFKRVSAYLINNIGKPIPASAVAEAMDAAPEPTTRQTVQKHLEASKKSLLFYEVKRFDLKEKKPMKQNPKYYLSDPGFRQLFLCDTAFDQEAILENLVFLELLRRGFQVFTGILNGMEIDFTARKDQMFCCMQVLPSVADEKLLLQKLRPLQKLENGLPKVLITLDERTQDVNGIRHLNALDFLCGAKL